MKMAAFFESIGAPLKNRRWSWGARRSKDGAIFLRTWNVESYVDSDGHQWVQIAFQHGNGPGWNERQEHIQAIESGARCFLVMCEVEDAAAVPWRIAAFDDRTVRVGGEIKHDKGSTWIRVVDHKSIFEVR